MGLITLGRRFLPEGAARPLPGGGIRGQSRWGIRDRALENRTPPSRSESRGLGGFDRGLPSAKRIFVPRSEGGRHRTCRVQVTAAGSLFLLVGVANRLQLAVSGENLFQRQSPICQLGHGCTGEHTVILSPWE